MLEDSVNDKTKMEHRTKTESKANKEKEKILARSENGSD